MPTSPAPAQTSAGGRRPNTNTPISSVTGIESLIIRLPSAGGT